MIASNPTDFDPAGNSGPLESFRMALRRQGIARLRAIASNLELPGRIAEAGAIALADAIAERNADVGAAEARIARLEIGPRTALGLMALTGSESWPASGLALAVSALGIEPGPAIEALIGAAWIAYKVPFDAPPLDEFDRLAGRDDVELLAHPTALSVARTVRPEGDGPPRVGEVRMIREADGLEPIVRMAALWQRVAEAPLRQTQQGTLYKRDRDRLEDDPVLAGPIADALEPLPDMVPLWIALATGLGLIAPEPGTDRIVAAADDYWGENAVHLPQMIAARWLGLRTWHEQVGIQEPGGAMSPVLALPFARPAALLWLATMGEADWVAVDDLAAHLLALRPGWDRLTLRTDGPTAGRPVRERARDRDGARPIADRPGESALRAILLGPAYQLGLVRAAEEVPGGRVVVQLTPMGRYAMALGPPPPPRPTFEHFLFVQPNFEMIAYRQGLTPSLIGQFSRFARWAQAGAALGLGLTPESVYRGLEGGLTPDQMLARLGRHSARPLPPGIAEALRTWSGRRERLAYYASTTLVEFATPETLAAALALWPGEPPIQVSDRLLLVEDERSIPFQRFRLAGSRDYRRPPEPCLEVESDGVTLALDLGRSDLMVDAELARFADELPSEATPSGGPRRRFRVSGGSLGRAVEQGITPSTLDQWFRQRTGTDLPPALRLMLVVAGGRVGPLRASRPILLTAPTPDLIDGLIQHPNTRDYFEERLGPTAVVVPRELLPSLRRALAELGLTLDEGPERLD